jgi:opacity protein-like surface antigen
MCGLLQRCHPNLAQTRDAKIEWFGTVRGRIGWLSTPTNLLYLTGGLAYGRVSASGTVTDDIRNTGASFIFGDARLKAGFAVGGGFEAAFANSTRWTLKLAGASSARHSPRPLNFLGGWFVHDPDASRRGNAELRVLLFGN